MTKRRVIKIACWVVAAILVVGVLLPTTVQTRTILTCTRGSDIFGMTTFFGCGPRHPVCVIPPATQREFVEKADAQTLAAFFDGVVSTNREAQRQAVQLAWDKILEK